MPQKHALFVEDAFQGTGGLQLTAASSVSLKHLLSLDV